MSGIYIPGMEMPKGEARAFVIVFSDGKAVISVEPFEWHEVIHVPDHGRLGDLDELKKKAEWANTDDDTDVRVVRLDSIDEAPTIIPADHADKESV